MFVGWMPRTIAAERPDSSRMLESIDPFGTADRRGTWLSPGIRLAQAQLQTSPEAQRGSIPAVSQVSGNTAVGWLRLKNRASLVRDLGLARRDEVLSDLDVVLLAYERWAEATAGHLQGEFSFGIWDESRHEVYLARDPLGTRPMFVSWSSEAAAFATTLAAFRGLPGIDDSPDPVWMACYIAGLPSGATGPLALRGARRLEAGHWGYLGQSGLSTHRYHTFRDDPPWEDHRDPAYLEAYRTELERAVGFGAQSEGPLGVEASGGLDSSTLVALAAKTRPDGGRGIHGLGYAIFELEPGFILATSAMWGIETNHIFTRWDNGRPGELEVRQRMFDTVAGHPCQHGSVLGFHEVLSTAQRNGINVLLSGFGGDEGVTNQGMSALDEFRQRGDWRAVARNFPSRPATRPLRAGQWLRNRRLGGPAGRDPHLLRRIRCARELFEPEVAEKLVELHPATRAQTFDPADQSVNSDVLRALSSPWMDIRLEQSAVFASAFGVEYRWPLLDAQLVQQYLNTPTVWKMADGMGRYLHRAALAGDLPDEILRYKAKHMGALIRADAIPVPRSELAGPAWAEQHSRLPRILSQILGEREERCSGPSPTESANLFVIESWLARSVRH